MRVPNQLVAIFALIFAISNVVDAKRAQESGVIINAIREINLSEPDIIHFEN